MGKGERADEIRFAMGTGIYCMEKEDHVIWLRVVWFWFDLIC